MGAIDGRHIGCRNRIGGKQAPERVGEINRLGCERRPIDRRLEALQCLGGRNDIEKLLLAGRLAHRNHQVAAAVRCIMIRRHGHDFMAMASRPRGFPPRRLRWRAG
jgi:hypothetical protein